MIMNTDPNYLSKSSPSQRLTVPRARTRSELGSPSLENKVVEFDPFLLWGREAAKRSCQAFHLDLVSRCRPWARASEGESIGKCVCSTVRVAEVKED